MSMIQRNTSHYHKAYRVALKRKILAFEGQVFLRRDLTKNRSNQVQLRLNRALNAFTDEGFIVKISHGLYAKAERMTLSNGENSPVLQASFEEMAIEALDKLALKWEWGRAIQEYNSGKTTQIPIAFTIRLKSRFRGTISAEGRTVLFEDGVNAR